MFTAFFITWSFIERNQLFLYMSSKEYMMQCLRLAEKGLSKVSPNPMVGCVVVKAGEIIGEGYHQQFGKAHAEVNAIHSVYDQFGEQATELLKNAEVYVNLEPCAHFGKTPPCSDLLIQKQVGKVYIANSDPFNQVDGKGIAKLNQAGILTEVGLLNQEARFLNRRFFTRIEKQRPYVILKWAETADHFFAPEEATQQWITGPESQALNFQWRNEEDAILVGKNTVLIDNPKLTARFPNAKNPIRIVIDQNLQIPENYHVYDQEAPTIIFNELKTEIQNQTKWIQMESMSSYLAPKICYQLYLMDIQSVIVEGGINILQQFLDADIWDEIRIIESSNSWGKGKKSPNKPMAKMDLIQDRLLGLDRLKIYLRK